MGPKAYLAYSTRKWCSGNTWSFDLHDMGSSPFFLGAGRILASIVHSIKVALGHSGTAPYRAIVVGVGL